MSSSTTETSVPETVPRMGAEGGFSVDETVPPLRFSGYVCLILGLASVFALVGPAALVIPALAILFGLVALRRYPDEVPAGLKPARVGLVLALAFGSCGFFIPVMKNYTLGSQAEKFARYYIEMIARGEDEFAMELRKTYNNRFPPTMPLKAYYAQNELSESEEHLSPFEEFKRSEVNAAIRRRGPGAEWELKRPPRVHVHYGQVKAELIFVDPTGQVESEIYISLDYNIDKRGDGQWNVERSMFNAEPIVAPMVL